jgi:hypothetical protein
MIMIYPVCFVLCLGLGAGREGEGEGEGEAALIDPDELEQRVLSELTRFGGIDDDEVTNSPHTTH